VAGKVTVGNRTGHASQTSVVYPLTGSRPRQEDEHPAYTPHGVWHTSPFYSYRVTGEGYGKGYSG